MVDERIYEDEIDAHYVRHSPRQESVRVQIGSLIMGDGKAVDLDIRDAVYFRYLLDGAIHDYEKAAGK